MAEVALDRLERWFLEVITHPEGVSAGGRAARMSIDEVLRPSESLTASERVGIYAGMYFNRLIEVLEDEFPQSFWPSAQLRRLRWRSRTATRWPPPSR